MKCPNCGLINPDSAQRCDCGCDFYPKKLAGNPDIFPLTFHSEPQSGAWWRSRWVLIGMGLVSILAGYASDMNNPEIAYLFGTGLVITGIIGFSRFRITALGGEVVIGDGWVRVYKLDTTEETNLPFEAPYPDFHTISVEWGLDADSEGYLTCYDPVIFLIHKFATPNKIALFDGVGSMEEGTLAREDYHTVQEISREMEIPIEGIKRAEARADIITSF